MPWIQNVAMSDVEKGLHFLPGENAMLIQIVDPDMEHPDPKYSFREIHRFKFLDVDDDHCVSAITQEQADQIAAALVSAKERRMNVIVHCVAGINRSGSVCEVGVIMGFDDPLVYRGMNVLVKKKLMIALGMTYEEEEPMFVYDDFFGIFVPNEKHQKNRLTDD